MTRVQRIAFGCIALLALSAVSCKAIPPTDPFTSTDLRIAQRLDLSRTYGAVIGKRTEHYIEPHPDFDARPGDTYYCIDVRLTDTNGRYTDTAYCGVPQAVYDAVEIGTTLPTIHVYNVFQIAQLQGRIVDRQADLEHQKWYVVVDHATEMRVYRVDPITYYRYLTVGQDLPFAPPRGRTASDPPPTPVP